MDVVQAVHRDRRNARQGAWRTVGTEDQVQPRAWLECCIIVRLRALADVSICSQPGGARRATSNARTMKLWTLTRVTDPAPNWLRCWRRVSEVLAMLRRLACGSSGCLSMFSLPTNPKSSSTNARDMMLSQQRRVARTHLHVTPLMSLALCLNARACVGLCANQSAKAILNSFFAFGLGPGLGHCSLKWECALTIRAKACDHQSTITSTKVIPCIYPRPTQLSLSGIC